MGKRSWASSSFKTASGRGKAFRGLGQLIHHECLGCSPVCSVIPSEPRGSPERVKPGLVRVNLLFQIVNNESDTGCHPVSLHAHDQFTQLSACDPHRGKAPAPGAGLVGSRRVEQGPPQLQVLCSPSWAVLLIYPVLCSPSCADPVHAWGPLR